MLPDSGGRRVLTAVRPKSVKQNVRRQCGDLVWMLSELTAEGRIIAKIPCRVDRS
jgi:hypothetical protein